MSIVEKAIKKVQGSLAGTADARGVGAASLGDAREVQPGTERPAAPSWPPLQPKRTIQIDREKLRAEGFLPPEDVMRAFLDQYRRVKWPVLAAAFGEKAIDAPRRNLVIVASSLPDEGKTFVSLNLAMSIASERDSRLLLVDADVAKAHLSEVLGLGEAPGLLDLLSKETLSIDDVIVATSIPNLYFIPAGRSSAGAPELMASRRMEQVADELSARFSDAITLFDSSPVLLTNESQVLAKLVGQILLVVRANHTPRPAVLESIGLLNSNNIGCILNQFEGGSLEYYYGDRYQYGRQREPQ